MKSKKIAIWTFFISLPILTITILLASFGIYEASTTIFIILSSLFITSGLYIVWLAKKADLTILISILVSFLGISFKSLHWPGAGPLLTIGFTVPSTFFFFIIFQKIKEFDKRTNRFLNFFKNLICFTLITSFLGFTFKLMHWPGGNMLKTISLPMFLLSIFSLIFLLPGSNFIEWSKDLKRMFFRALLIPLLYMTIITTMANVFPVTFQGIFFNKSWSAIYGFNTHYYEIPMKDGM